MKSIKNKNSNKKNKNKKKIKKSIKNNQNLIGSAHNSLIIPDFGRLFYYHDYYPENDNIEYWFKNEHSLMLPPDRLNFFSKIIDLKNYFEDILHTHILDIFGKHFSDTRDILLNNPESEKLYLLSDNMNLLNVAINYNRRVFICTNTTSSSRLKNLNYNLINSTNHHFEET